jgi:hypothetical protein
MRNIHNRVILILGRYAVQRYFCVHDRSKATLSLIYKSIKKYDFDTEEEAEAFRMGLCACEDNADAVCEMTEAGYKSFIKLVRETFQRKTA